MTNTLIRQNQLRCKFASLVVILFTICCGVAHGETLPSPPVTPPPSTSLSEQSVQLSVSNATAIGNDGQEVQTATFGSHIRVKVNGLAERAAKDMQFDFRKLILFIDENAFKGVYPIRIDLQANTLEYDLPDKVAAKDMWKPILRSPPWGGDKEVSVSVGTEDSASGFPPTDFKKRPSLQLTLFSGAWWLLLAIVVAVGIALSYLAKKSNIIRDSTPSPNDATKLPPYSLAKTQAAIWFYLVFAAFIFLWWMTGSFNGLMTANILALMGIGAGTTLGSAMIEATKSEKEQQQRTEIDAQLKTLSQQYLANASASLKKQIDDLEQSARPASRNIVLDLLTDVNGITLHRFQMLVWTLALNIVFISGVYQNLAMPEFDAQLLALMGISSGVYLGFKISEAQLKRP